MRSFIRENTFEQPTTQRRNSPAGKLRFKALQVRADFTAYANSSDVLQSDPSNAYAVRSVKKGYDTKLDLGILPIKSTASSLLSLPVNKCRPANIITRDDHFIQSANANDLQDFFEDSFPQLSFSGKISVIEKGEFSRFANSPGTVFPHPQHAKRLKTTASPNSGVVLIGDAAHAFPPDIAQGLNAALVDVLELESALSSTNHNSLADALCSYQKVRMVSWFVVPCRCFVILPTPNQPT